MPDRIQSSSKCPICAKPALERFRPFCSKRCADIDLNRWLTGAYVIPGKAEENDDEPGDEAEPIDRSESRGRA